MSGNRIKNFSVPISELAGGLAGKTISGDVAGANYIVPRTMVVPLGSGGSSELSFAVQNPEDYPLVIRAITAVIRTAGQSSASLNVGIVASSSKTASDLLSSGDIATAGVTIYAPTGVSIWEKNGNSSDAWLTAKIVVDGASSLTGQMLIEVVPFRSS